jgi:chromosome segregation ATPase
VGGSLSTVSKHWKEFKNTNGLDILKIPPIKNPTDDLTNIFMSEVNRQISDIKADYETKCQQNKNDEDYLRSYMSELENQNKALESSEAEAKEKAIYMAGEKNSTESRLKGLEGKIENLQEELKKSLLENSSLEGALHEARNIFDLKLAELFAEISTESSKKLK